VPDQLPGQNTPLGGIGIWCSNLRYGDPGRAADAAAEFESLGYTALWIPDIGGDVFGPIANLLQATVRATIATGILNLWMHGAQETAEQHASLTLAHGPRFLLGIGASHAPLIEHVFEAGAYKRPLAKMVQYLDELDAADPPLAPGNRLLAALGPKMLALAAARSAGVHPYLVTPEHTSLARDAVGPNATVAVEQGVIHESNAGKARAIARANLVHYMDLPNYVNNWKRLGFDDTDVTDGGSDRLIDALVAWGDDKAIAGRVQEHLDAGASHVCIQIMNETGELPLKESRVLASALI
jgi:probable F420-dependent oxidoreductase